MGLADYIERLQPESPTARRVVRITGIVALVLVVLWVPNMGFTKDPEGVLPLFTIVLCAVYARFPLGPNIVVGFAGLLGLGYAAFFLFGALPAAWLISDFGYEVRSRASSSAQQ